MNVYVITSDGGMCKIGIATNPDRRLASLSTGHPFKMAVAYALGVDDEYSARKVEAKAHYLLDAHRLVGEWFGVGVDDAIAAVRSASMDSYIPPKPSDPVADEVACARELARQKQYRERRAAKIDRLATGHRLILARLDGNDKPLAVELREIAQAALADPAPLGESR